MPFFLLKGLSFLPFGGLLKNPKVLIGGILIIALAFAYFKWKGAIKERIYNEIYTQQAEQHIENQRREQERVQQLITEGNRAVSEAQARREALIREIERARSQTRNVAPEDNGQVAPVLEEALSFIRARQGTPSAPREPTLGDRAGEALDQGLDATRGAVERAEGAIESTGNSVIDAWRKARKK